MVSVKPDPRMWAKKIIARHDAGEHVSLVALEFARIALESAPGPVALSFVGVAAATSGVYDREAIDEREAIRQESIEYANRQENR